jgi:glutaredoxin
MDITIFTSDHCPSCKETIRFFQEKEIFFRQLDVGFNRENFAEMLRLGGFATPFIVIDSKTFYTFDREKLEEVLADVHG